MSGPMMDAAAYLTYEGLAADPVETHLNLEKPVYILGRHFRPDQGKVFLFQHLLLNLCRISSKIYKTQET